jgi:RNA polymerase sigma-B factor
VERSAGEPGNGGRSTATSRLLRAYHEGGDITARERLIELYLPLVETLARRYEGRGVESDDLVQVGSIGLINAIDRFDPARGGELTAFAVPNILGEIKRHFRDRRASVRVPRREQELRARLERAREELATRLGRAPTAAELASEAKIEGAEVDRVLAAGAASRADEEIEAAQVEAEASDERLLLAGAFRTLSAQERQIVYLRFVHDRGRAEVAEEMGISQRHLSRQTQSALAKLRRELERSHGTDESATVAEPAATASPRRLSPDMQRPKMAAMGTTGTRVPEGYLDLPYHVSIVRSDEGKGAPGWTAQVDELPGCAARGTTPDDAERALRAAMEEWISEALAKGRKVPEPRSAASHSGRLLLRMPQSLHGELARAAEREDVSLNQFITGSLASAVGWRPGDEDSEPRARPAEQPSGRPPSMPSPVAASASGSRWVPLAIVANTVVVAIAGVVAVILLVIAWQQGW